MESRGAEVLAQGDFRHVRFPKRRRIHQLRSLHHEMSFFMVEVGRVT